jgi:hypothetical protein
VTLHDLFDGIILPVRGGVFPPSRPNSQTFFIFYKVAADQQCRISLKVLDPSGREVPGNWRDSITPQGPSIWQAIWALNSSLFNMPGDYHLDLMQENDYPIPMSFPLVSTILGVRQGE